MQTDADQKPRTKTRRSRLLVRAAEFAVALFLALTPMVCQPQCVYVARLLSRTPSRVHFSGPIDGQVAGPYGYGPGARLTPDGKTLAYIWTDREWMYPYRWGARPVTLTESMEVRIRRLDAGGQELRFPLDSVDLRPEGITYFNLDVGTQESPDSRHVAGYCARRFVLIDLVDGTSRAIEYKGEYIRSLAWLGSREIVFSITDDANVMTFWRYAIDSPPSERTRVYSEACPNEVLPYPGLPPDLHGDRWSPNGTFVCFRSYAKDPMKSETALLDLRTGSLQTLSMWPYFVCWKSDETGVLLADASPDAQRLLLVEPISRKVTDLTAAVRREFGPGVHVTLTSPLWTTDNQYVLLYRTIFRPRTGGNKRGSLDEKGYVIQPQPFRVVYNQSGILRPSPVPGWVFVQGETTFTWLHWATGKTAPIDGWVNDWVWSADGKLAATISKEKVEVFPVSPPPGAE